MKLKLKTWWTRYKWWVYSTLSSFIGVLVIAMHNVIFHGYNIEILYNLVMEGELLHVSFTIIILAMLNNYRYIKVSSDFLNVSIGFVAILNAIAYSIIRYTYEQIDTQVVRHLTLGFLALSIALCFMTERSVIVREG